VTPLLAVLAVLGLAAGPEDAALTVIVGATLVDGGGRAPVADSVVVVRGAVITAVGDRVHTPIPKGAALVDGRRSWIAPAPATATPDAALSRAISGIVRGPAARLQAGQPAHLALLDADPRRDDGAPARVRRLWVSGQSRAIAAETVR
jgi:hypothetical protein